MMRTITATLVLAMSALFSPCLAAEKISLTALDGSEAIGNAERKAAEDGLTSVETYPDQSFSVALAGEPLATLVLARADSTAMPNSSICFLAYATKGASSSPTILRAIGSGNFENTTCDGVEAVATATKGDETKLIVLFQSRSPNYSLIEPVVFDFAADVAAISIDQPASIAASDAASMTIKDVRAAIAK